MQFIYLLKLLLKLNGNIFCGLSDNYEEAKKVKEGTVITVKHSGVNIAVSKILSRKNRCKMGRSNKNKTPKNFLIIFYSN
jgi:hypothetical protein